MTEDNPNTPDGHDVLPERRTADIPIIGTSIGAVVVPVTHDEDMVAAQFSTGLTTALFHFTYEQMEQIETEFHNLRIQMKRPGHRPPASRKKAITKVEKKLIVP